MSARFIVELVLLLLAALLAYPLYRVARASSRGDRMGIAVAFVLTIAIPWLPQSLEVRAPGGAISQVTVVAPWLHFVLLVALFGTTVLLALSGAKQQRRPLILTGVLWTLCATLIPCVNVTETPQPWQVGASRRHPRGDTYALLTSGMLEHEHSLLGRERAAHWYGAAFTVLGESSAEEPRAWLPVIRPEGEDRALRGQVLFAHDGKVVAFRALHECSMIYDPSTHRFWGKDGIRTASPFVLMGKDTRPSQRDVDRTLRAMDRIAESDAQTHAAWLASLRRGEVSGFPLESVLVRGLAHANPRVRTIARQLLERERELTEAPEPSRNESSLIEQVRGAEATPRPER
jgi:hypothetical protein